MIRDFCGLAVGTSRGRPPCLNARDHATRVKTHHMLLVIAIFLAALAVALAGGRLGLRCLVVLALVLAPLRGGLLTLAEELSLSETGLTVNALVPALVAAVAIGCAVQRRPRLADLPRLLLVGWALIAAAVALSFLTSVVSLKLYGIGVAQYLVYPTLALAIWPLLEPGDARRLTRLLIVLGSVVAGTVLLQAMGVEGFIQAAGAHVEGLAANRYAGITGSYLHTSAFLGVAAVLAMGEFAQLPRWAPRLGGTALLAVILSGEVLTFSRSGVVIAMIGAFALFLFAMRGSRISFAVLVVPAMVIAIAAGSIGGVSPSAAGARVSSGFHPSNDPGNKLRTESFEKGLQVYRDATVPQKAIGRGVASTGNARQLVDEEQPQVTVESYYLKLLVETGIVGLVMIAAFLVWAAIAFALEAWHPVSPWSASVAAAGLGLSLYNGIYPALETQILALAWWLLLVLCLTVRREHGAPRAPATHTGEANRPQMVGTGAG
jgi:O-antigen ligase